MGTFYAASVMLLHVLPYKHLITQLVPHSRHSGPTGPLRRQTHTTPFIKINADYCDVNPRDILRRCVWGKGTDFNVTCTYRFA